jgi:hypothetical protein
MMPHEVRRFAAMACFAVSVWMVLTQKAQNKPQRRVQTVGRRIKTEALGRLCGLQCSAR